MLLEDTGLNGLKSELAHLDETADQLGFVRWQWEYYRATYDYAIEHEEGEYYLRINTRATEGKLESPHAVLAIESVYLGKATFPHGIDYDAEIPSDVLKEAENKVEAFRQALS